MWSHWHQRATEKTWNALRGVPTRDEFESLKESVAELRGRLEAAERQIAVETAAAEKDSTQISGVVVSELVKRWADRWRNGY
jgi:hypothetical protein